MCRARKRRYCAHSTADTRRQSVGAETAADTDADEDTGDNDDDDENDEEEEEEEEIDVFDVDALDVDSATGDNERDAGATESGGDEGVSTRFVGETMRSGCTGKTTPTLPTIGRRPLAATALGMTAEAPAEAAETAAPAETEATTPPSPRRNGTTTTLSAESGVGDTAAAEVDASAGANDDAAAADEARPFGVTRRPLTVVEGARTRVRSCAGLCVSRWYCSASRSSHSEMA